LIMTMAHLPLNAWERNLSNTFLPITNSSQSEIKSAISSESPVIRNTRQTTCNTQPTPATSTPQLFQHLTALPFIHIIQCKTKGRLQQGGFVIDSNTGQLQFMELEGKAVENVN